MASGVEPGIIWKVGVWIIGMLSTAVGTLWWYDKTTKDKDYKDLRKITVEQGKQLTAHETKFVTDSKVREIVKDELLPLKESVNRMDNNLTLLIEKVSDLSGEVKALNKVSDYVQQHDKDK